MKASEIFRQKVVLKHVDHVHLDIFEVAIFEVPKSQHYPEGIKYRAWFSERGETIFGFDNHKPKGPHLHIGLKEKAGFIYEE